MKTLLPILTMYTAIALPLSVLPAKKVPGTRSSREPVSLLGAALEPETAFARTSNDWDHDYRETKEEKIQKSFPVTQSRLKALEIDNIWGSIQVMGDAANTVELTVERSTRAESKAKIEKADEEVTLDITQDEGTLKLYVNGPFRCQCDDCRHNHDDEGYRVKMNFQVHLPKQMSIKVLTVNEGSVLVRDMDGNFLVRNVNGRIDMENLSGSGTAQTVNGPVTASFRQNPKENSDFKTINGAVELRFTHNLSADFRLKTFNGGIYSDFPVTAMPVRAVEQERHGGKVIYRSDRFAEVRVNAGGPQIQVENLNGDIRILENHE